jgi:hypothetical protein
MHQTSIELQRPEDAAKAKNQGLLLVLPITWELQ